MGDFQAVVRSGIHNQSIGSAQTGTHHIAAIYNAVIPSPAQAGCGTRLTNNRSGGIGFEILPKKQGA